MADLSITEVQLSASSVWQSVRFGAAATLGDVCYVKEVNNISYWYPAQADGQAIESGQFGLGIAVHGVGAGGENGVIVTSGLIYITTAPADGTTYILSTATGKMAPDADFAGYAADTFKTLLGVGGDTFGSGAEFLLNPFFSGIQK
jgi:hypothetical protein